MNLKLEIRKNNKIILRLADNRKVIDSSVWKENNNLSRTLLRKIDESLKKNKIGLDPAPIPCKLNNKKIEKSKVIARKNWCGVDKISGFEIISNVPKKWTSYRIAEITFEGLKIARQNFRRAKT